MEWCVKKPNKLAGLTHEEWLQEYTRWVFGPFPYHRKGTPLFAHGNFNARTGCRREVNLKDGPDSSVTIFTNDPIILDVMNANFIISDIDRLGNIIQNEMDVLRALDFEDQMHSQGKVEFKSISDISFTDLSTCVEDVRTLPFEFLVSKYNPYLREWDVPMPAGIQKGAMSSQLLLFKIPQAGEYFLKFEARSFSDFESCGIYQIIVVDRNITPGQRSHQKYNFKDRYADLKGRVLSVTTGNVLSLDD